MPARDSVAQQPPGTLSTATMSDEEEAVAEAEEIIRSQRIFLNHLDSYGGRNIGKVGAQGCIAQKREGGWSSASGRAADPPDASPSQQSYGKVSLD